ncbi:uncharacterized protein TrAtP1_002307 [Trichoderma atroviride]|uniref:uncharacterized protein n=1 Tax=Hypocrea atroviridis TaxID=63577 RepID=UPI00331CF736|nr:hypothetical protein TrAtP1_002307 [Trichoderma atroviride]
MVAIALLSRWTTSNVAVNGPRDPSRACDLSSETRKKLTSNAKEGEKACPTETTKRTLSANKNLKLVFEDAKPAGDWRAPTSSNSNPPLDDLMIVCR